MVKLYMETLSSFIYFVITFMLFWAAKKGKTGEKHQARRYSRAEMVSCEGVDKAPEGFLAVESIRSSFGSRPNKFRGKMSKSVNEKKNDENFKGSNFRDIENLGTVGKMENKENKEIRENKDNKENVFNQNSILSSFILKELENSVKELTCASKPTKPVAPSGYSFGSLKSNARTQPNGKFLNANAQEYVIRKNY